VRSRSPSSYEDADELEALRNERDRLRRSIRHLTMEIPPALESTVIDPHDLPTPEGIEEAIDLAREHLFNVEIPDGAVRDVAELDATPKYRVWGSAVWQALLALNDYVGAKRHGEQPAGFYLWCDRTNAWPTAKLAMSESDTVENNPRLRDQRLFPVPEEVDPSGRIHMFAHLKIQAGGGDNIPRLYFYDESDGRTGKMHIGFVGPHRHVRNRRR
jgi:hypothetical protein